uniref:restriction endonuclease n=1 Tax=Pseudomonas arsenicoxydans TaxID=702115 RepID=UPI0036F38F28
MSAAQGIRESTASSPLISWGQEKVYVQAKRWQNTVGRPGLQAFCGALAGC